MLVFIKEFRQLDARRFQIDWNDDKYSIFELSFLQKNCPCARCKEILNKKDSEVSARKISSVGNYAIRIDFTKGCSRGVFTFDFLRTLDLEEL